MRFEANFKLLPYLADFRDNIFDALQAAEKTANNTTLSVAM